ncbi:hypothetical protein JM946_23710 [Steroidobacter sp. S1-65]|uniref:Uncharacterized protein n=1 Tax=Steroidobacter gossypii TaxID=2805490 RepID=A0ABS1X3F7_9GAMM|nr:hypothetical protein [Steroidobacter gossypii]MBM0107763.1 hypothetical protein [Steroidobacter gossypii]
MSEDSRVFLKSELFPHDVWKEILELFLAEQREQRGTRSRWVVPEPTVWLSVQEIGASHVQFGRYRWQIGIHYSSSYDPMKLWVTVAIPYHCLLLMEGAVYHGPEPDGGPVIADVDEFSRYAKNFLLRRTSLQKLVKHGVMDADENLTLDRQAWRRERR